MNCEEFVEQVTAFLDGALSPEGEREFIDHIAECDGCERYLDQMRRTSQALQDLPANALPGDARSALLTIFRGRSPQ